MVNQIKLPSNLSAEKLIAVLETQFQLQPLSKQYLIKTFYDSFDWRLYRKGLVCELNRAKQATTLALTDSDSGEAVASAVLFDMPAFANDLEPGKVRQTLAPILEMRALLPVATLECESHQIQIALDDNNAVVRLVVDQYDLVNNRLSVFADKGHQKEAKRVVEWLSLQLGLTVADKPLLVDALKIQGRQPKDYTGKLNIALDPHTSSDQGCKAIFTHLLKAIKLNEQGVIADIDSEFLHDYRVAVRRTRVLLGQFKKRFPNHNMAKHQQFFSWLGKATSETRDLDVYLLNFGRYKKLLPKDIRQHIAPLQKLLAEKKLKQHTQLANKLKTSKYKSAILAWEHFLASLKPTEQAEQSTIPTTKALADLLIWKAYKRVMKEGKAIDGESQPEALHQLRKTCKKLRYLMEFFQSLYPAKPIDKAIKKLKQLQDVLGVFQDLSVQIPRLEQFSEELMKRKSPSKTFMAIGTLIRELEHQKAQVRDDFETEFKDFASKENRAVFADLFKPTKAQPDTSNEIDSVFEE